MKPVRRLTLVLAFALGLPALAKQPTLFTNHYDPAADTPKLDAEKAVVFDPVGRWTYAHHPTLAFFKGCLYAAFSNGPAGEDEPGQRILLSRSENFTDWSEPEVLLEPGAGDYGQPEILTPGGLKVIGDSLVLYYTVNDNDGTSNRRLDPTLHAIVTRDGLEWSDPIRLSLRVFPCHSPLTLSDGRILLTGNTLVYYTDDPSGTGRWNRCRMELPEFQDGAITFDQVRPSLCEGALLEHPDGQVFCLLRSTGKTYDGYLWQMQSADGGRSWSSPVKSRFTDNNTKSFFGRLPDGRCFYVGTPDTTHPGERWPLVLALSDDGYDYDRTWILSDDRYAQQYRGRWKGGEYGYPYAILHDGYVYVILSRRKERIEVIRIETEALK
ncbi:exo-alpha-sialidase [Alistipes sp.]|uniref:exo-alpha-sialidase n=1 Tax=Alistipes sp. TaxID=1872444 RepID=UPI003AF046E2